MPDKFFGTKAVPVAAPVLPTPEGAKPATVLLRTNLNIRSGPGTSHTVLGTLQPGAPVFIYAAQGDWCKIHPTEDRWVSGRYLKQ